MCRTQASAGARNSLNPIADLLGRIKMAPPHPDRQLISLAMGDPTACGNLGPPMAAVAALQEALASGNFNGYGPSHGDVAARAAVAKYVYRMATKIVQVDRIFIRIH
ncbi:MAG: aminotransferase class I/II-fold pyridoxal phosphate-dependent enzyme [bacterium]